MNLSVSVSVSVKCEGERECEREREAKHLIMRGSVTDELRDEDDERRAATLGRAAIGGARGRVPPARAATRDQRGYESHEALPAREP